MRIALIQTFQSDAFNSIPINLLSPASYIKQHGHQPIIIDFNVLLKKNNISPDFFRKAAKKILKHKPQVLGFSVMWTTFPATLLIAKECKILAPQLPIIFGGPEVSFEEIKVLKTFKQVDLIISGEGEITLLEILNALENRKPFSNILGISYRKDKRSIRNPDRPFIKNLDELPFLNYSLLPFLERYDGGRIEAGRGCPHQCTFCSSCKLWRRHFRMKSPQRLAQELRETYAILKNDEKSRIEITHDHLLTSRKKADEFLSLISDDGIHWTCAARIEALDGDLIKKMKKAGCQSVQIGIESASPKIQKEIKKNLPLEKLPQVLELLIHNDISACLCYIIGFPNEKINQLNQTLNMALMGKLYNFPAAIEIQPLQFLKGSELYEGVKDKFKRPYLQQIKNLPLTTGLPAELSLIKKHPQIFPSYYHVGENDLHPEFLEKISILFFFLIGSFPLTMILSLQFSAATPFQLIQKIIHFFDSTGLEWITFQDGIRGFHYYLPFFEKFINNNSTPLIKETFSHEKLLRKSTFVKKDDLPPNKKINLAFYPKIARNVKIKTYKYDIFSLMDILRTNQRKKSLKIESYIAYLPGEIAQSFPLTSLSFLLLSLCDGKKSIQQIINKVLGRKNRAKKAKKVIMENFRFLKDKSIITSA